MVTRAQIVAVARRHLGTPWQHQARCPGVALDCIGLLVVVAQALALPHVDYTRYGVRPNPDELLERLGANLDRIEAVDAREGDVVLFWIESADRPQHVGIRTATGFIHTHAGIGRVVEHGWGGEWTQRVHSWWRFREVA